MEEPSLVDREYDAHLDSMSGVERVACACSLFDAVVAMLSCQVLRESPDLSEDELKLQVAKILYLSDEGAQRLLRLARQNA